MIEFIICDDNKKYVKIVEDIVSKVMLKNNIEYKISKFFDYDQTFLDHIKIKNSIRIYILDIETPTNSGIIIAKKIRKVDYESQIIFLTGHEYLGNLILRKDLLFLSFINKFEDIEKRLCNSIEQSLKISSTKKYFEINEKGSIYKISFDRILYFTRDTVERKTLIITDTNSHKIIKNFYDILPMLDNRFIQTHRSCIINLDRAEEVNYRKKFIVFDNGKKIDLITNKFKNNGDKNE